MKIDQDILSDYETLVEIGYSLSQQFEGVETEDRRKSTSTFILAKVIPKCISLLKLIPGSTFSQNDEEDDFYDFPSIAALARNIIEATNLLYYLCIEEISQKEKEFRFKLFDLHEASELLIIIDRLQFATEHRTKIKTELENKRAKLESDPFFKELKKGEQKTLKKGKRSTHLTQFMIAERRDLNLEFLKGMYKFLSVQTHSAPLAISQVVYAARKDIRNNENIPFVELTIEYTSHFIADMILSISSLWGIEFNKKSSKQLVISYAKDLSEY